MGARPDDPSDHRNWLVGANFIDGEWVDGTGESIDVVNPFTGKTVGQVPNFGGPETRAAIAAADHVFSAWSSRPAQDRAEILHCLAALIRDHRESLARLITIEQGKPLAEARGEITASAAYIQWFAEEARRIYGDVIPATAPGRQLLVVREAVGVVGCITPWNFPSLIVARKLGPALATGCTVVLKPSEFTPFSALALGRLAAEAGVPPGVVNIVTGDAQSIGDALIESDVVRKISFTGSTAIGRMLAERAGRALKRVSLELGGNAPFIVFDDADLDRAIEGAMVSKFRNAGQTCVCTNRFFVQVGIHDAFVDRFKSAIAKLRLGDGLAADTTLGPLINALAVSKYVAHVEDAVAKGATLAQGEMPRPNGCLVEPVLLTGCDGSMRLAREETFAPLAAVYRFETLEEVEELANDSGAGLVAYAYTKDMGRAFRLSRTLKFGQVGLNEGLITTEVAPFGGVKDSGLGREGSKYGCDDYTDLKYICLGGL